jgi:hypothetical protein
MMWALCGKLSLLVDNQGTALAGNFHRWFLWIYVEVVGWEEVAWDLVGLASIIHGRCID